MVTGVGNATLYQGNLVKGYLTIPKKPGVRPISIPHPLGWGGRTQFDLLGFIFSPRSGAIEKKIPYLDILLLSFRSFTKLGTEDWYSKNNYFKILIALEGLLGWVMLAIFIATLNNVLMRP